LDRSAAPAKPATGLTCARSTGILKAMEVSLPENQEAQLNNLALRTGRGTDDLIQEAVARLLARNEWFKEQVQTGIDQIARGEFIEEEEMDARVKRMLES
jgi:predicted transcriptional regulator